MANLGPTPASILKTKITGTSIGTKHAQDVNIVGLASGNIDLAVRVDEPSSTVTYIGKAAIGTSDSAAAWKIFKMELISTETIITWADGDSDFNNVWDDRASLTYS